MHKTTITSFNQLNFSQAMEEFFWFYIANNSVSYRRLLLHKLVLESNDFLTGQRKGNLTVLFSKRVHLQVAFMKQLILSLGDSTSYKMEQILDLEKMLEESAL